jgi:hypothetical protein
MEGKLCSTQSDITLNHYLFQKFKLIRKNKFNLLINTLINLLYIYFDVILTIEVQVHINIYW